jgi:hypothetical protein
MDWNGSSSPCQFMLVLIIVVVDICADNYTVASFLEAIEDQAASGSNDQEREQRRDQDVMEEGQ